MRNLLKIDYDPYKLLFLDFTILYSNVNDTNTVVIKGTYRYTILLADDLRPLLINHNTGIAGSIPMLLTSLIVFLSTLFFKTNVIVLVAIIMYANIETGSIKILIMNTSFSNLFVSSKSTNVHLLFLILQSNYYNFRPIKYSYRYYTIPKTSTDNQSRSIFSICSTCIFRKYSLIWCH